MKLMSKILLSVLSIIVMFPVAAQAPPAPPATPIDGGLSLLLAAGGLYGIKKLRDKKN